MPANWRGHRVGRNICCTKTCATRFAFDEVARLEGWLVEISTKSRGLGRSHAITALYTNNSPGRL